LVFKIGGASGVAGLSRWRARGAITKFYVEVKQNHEDGVSVRCSKKKMDENFSKRVIGVVSSVGAKPRDLWI
jgi:hypothetical protein